MLKQKKNLTSVIATLVSISLLVLGTVGLIVLQKPLEESQDVRSDASVDGGQVSVTGSPSGGSFDQGSLTINLQANTQGVQTDGVQLVFNVISNTIGATPVISVPSSTGLQNAYSNVQQTADGYLISVIAIPQQLGQTFSANSPTTIAQLELLTTQAGNIELNFDRETSKSIIHATVPPQDTLTHIETLSYAINSNPTDPSPSPTVTPSPAVSPNPSPTPTTDPGTGGVEVQGCNESCSSNAECETNHRCYNGQCRLVTNVSSTTCQNQSDQGLNFGCDHYCANSTECDSDYSCLENRCRRADNPSDEYCRVPSSTLQTQIQESCNDACSSHDDCPANMACFNNQCRLVTNISSSTCSAPTVKTVSTLYNQDETTPKGGDIEDQYEATDSTIPAAIISKPSPSPLPTTQPANKDETALDAVVSTIRKSGLPINLFPIIALAAGGLILLLIVIPRLFGKKSKPTAQKAPQKKIDQAADKYQQELQAKLAELKTQPVVPPTTISEPQAVKPPVPTPPQPTTADSKPTSSSMMERVKEKGVNPPQS